MLDIEKVKSCYEEYKTNLPHFLDIDKAYNCDNRTRTLPTKRFERCYRDIECNYIQKLDDEESNYSFNNKVYRFILISSSRIENNNKTKSLVIMFIRF